MELIGSAQTHLIHLGLRLLQATVAGEIGRLIPSLRCRGSSWGRPGEEREQRHISQWLPADAADTVRFRRVRGLKVTHNINIHSL